MASRRHFGSVRRLTSGRYQASYWHRAVRHIAPITFVAKADAQGWLSDIETSIRSGQWVDSAAGRMTVEELAATWRQRDPSKRGSTRARDETILRLHVLPALGRLSLREVTPPHVQALVNAWTTKGAPRTVDRQYDVVRAMFRYAVQSDWLARSPCRGIKLPAVVGHHPRSLTAAEVAALAEAIDSRYELMVWIGAVLGLRWAEVAGLTVDSLDLVGGVVTVSHQLSRDGLLVEPKSAAGRRRFSLPPDLVELVLRHLELRGLDARNQDSWVFAAPGGGPLDYSHWRRRIWLPAVERSGLPGVVYHDLRRTNASTLVAAGVDIKTAQTRLGHSDPRLTLAVYAQALPEADRAASKALGKRLLPRTPRLGTPPARRR
jgi:integrase